MLALSETWHFDKNNDDFKKVSLHGFHDYAGKEGTASVVGVAFLCLVAYVLTNERIFQRLSQTISVNLMLFGWKLKNATVPTYLSLQFITIPKKVRQSSLNTLSMSSIKFIRKIN